MARTYVKFSYDTGKFKGNVAVMPGNLEQYGIKEMLADKTFDSQVKARKYAIEMMDKYPRIFVAEVSNASYMADPRKYSSWVNAGSVRRTNEKGKYYWSNIHAYAGWGRGSGHYINKDGTLSKKAYEYYAKDW